MSEATTTEMTNAENAAAEVTTDAAENQHVEDNASENSDDGFIKIEQKKLGQMLSQTRKEAYAKAEAKLRAEMNRPQQMSQPVDGMIFDPQTGEQYPLDSAVGQQVYREQRIAERKQQAEIERAQAAYQAELEEVNNKILTGHGRFDNYQACLNSVAQSLGSKESISSFEEVLTVADDPAAIINFLADKKGEVHRIMQLPPSKQKREIFRLEAMISPPKKLVTQAVPPVSKIKTANANTGVRPTEMSPSQINEFWEKRTNHR